MALPNLSGSNIQDTFQRVIHTDGTNVFDGTGSTMPLRFEGNNVYVPGILIADSYIVTQSITNVTSGSTIFTASSLPPKPISSNTTSKLSDNRISRADSVPYSK